MTPPDRDDKMIHLGWNTYIDPETLEKAIEKYEALYGSPARQPMPYISRQLERTSEYWKAVQAVLDAASYVISGYRLGEEQGMSDLEKAVTELEELTE